MYVAARKLLVSGVVYQPGDEVPVSAVPPRTLRNLLTLRRLLEVEAPTEKEWRDPPTMSAPPQPTGDVSTRKRGRSKGARNKPKTAALVAAEA